MDFNNKVVLITGASSGIGKELVIQLAGKNCKLAILARRENLLTEIIASLPNKENILAIKCDVSKKDEVQEAYHKIISKFGRIDIAILNAGYSVRMPIKEYNSEFAESIFGANVFGMIYWIEQLLPDFLKRKDGMIVGVSSLADSKGYSKSGFYSASKAAATIYLEGLSSDLHNHNVKVITVKPGFVKTPMTDKNEFKMPLIMVPEKAARIIIKGIEKEKRLIQFPWQLVILIKIISLIPNKIFEKLERLSLKQYD